jgi:hypothetical protein
LPTAYPGYVAAKKFRDQPSRAKLSERSYHNQETKLVLAIRSEHEACKVVA